MNKHLTSSRLALGLGLLLAGCASTETRTSLASINAETAQAPAPRSLTSVASALECMLGAQSDAPACGELAHLSASTPEAIRRAEPAAIEQLTESLSRMARAELMPTMRRAVVLRWVDLLASAAREARLAREGAECRALTACAASANGQPETADAEEAARADAHGVRSRAHLSALLAYVDEASELSADVEASALLVLAHRAESANHARPEVRDDAVASLRDALAELQAPPAGNPTPQPAVRAAAHDRDGASVLTSAQSVLAERLAAVSSRVVTPALRAHVERARERIQTTRR